MKFDSTRDVVLQIINLDLFIPLIFINPSFYFVENVVKLMESLCQLNTFSFFPILKDPSQLLLQYHPHILRISHVFQIKD